MKKSIAFASAVAGALMLGAAGAPGASAQPGMVESFEDPTCLPQGNVRFICGRTAPEDIAPLLGTDWVVTSAFTGAVGLHLNSIKDEKLVTTLYPSPNARKQQDMVLYGSCPGPLSAEQEKYFVAHGIHVRKVSDSKFTLYSVGHGPRESVEIFNLDVPKGQRPIVTWIGCAVAPGQETFNSVALLPDNGFVVSNTFEKRKGYEVPKALTFFGEFTGDPLLGSQVDDVAAKRAAGQNTGYILEWHPKAGYSKVPGSDGSGNSSLETSPDGKWVYYVTGTTISRLSRGLEPMKKDTAPTADIAPDNMKWTADGKKLLIAGSAPGTPAAEPPTGKVIEMDPLTFATKEVVRLPVRFTTAQEIGDTYWIGSSRALRLTLVPKPRH